jgi:hypothetical protein
VSRAQELFLQQELKQKTVGG